jgi:hypothetical protein
LPQNRKKKGNKRTRANKSTYITKKPNQTTRLVVYVLIGALALAMIAYILFQPGGGGDVSSTTTDATPPSSGLQIVDLVEGTGEMPQRGQTVKVHYTGTFENGIKFDSSHDRNQPYEFALGTGPVIQGWHEGIATMKVGGKRKLVIPPHLAYGERGRPGIPPNSTLVFEIELLGIR